MHQQQRSEVARILNQIDAEVEASRAGLYGLAYGMSRHDFITARTEQVAHLVEELRQSVGDEAAKEALVQHGGKA